MKNYSKRLESNLRKAYTAMEKQESRMAQSSVKARPAAWKTALEKKIPENVFDGLETAFSKGFSIVFDHGRMIIEKTYNKGELETDYAVRDYAVGIKGRQKDLENMQKNARRADVVNLAVTTVEGVGLGIIGVGIPDIVLFLSTLLKGVYETAINYGFEYESRQEQLLILKMLETALSDGEDWSRKNTEVDEMLVLETVDISDEEYAQQLKATSSAFAVDMLLLKFIQGIPVIGVFGGAANPVYYRKIMKYVQLKYWKRYLLRKMEA